jgi:hypothetical protein
MFTYPQHDVGVHGTGGHGVGGYSMTVHGETLIPMLGMEVHNKLTAPKLKIPEQIFFFYYLLLKCFQ